MSRWLKNVGQFLDQLDDKVEKQAVIQNQDEDDFDFDEGGTQDDRSVSGSSIFQRLVQPPHGIVIIHVVAEVLVTDVFKSAVAGAGNPVEEAPQPGIMFIALEDGVDGLNKQLHSWSYSH